MAEELMRWPLVAATLKISRSTAWRLEKAGKFPHRRQISAKSVGWLRSEVEAWAQSLDLADPRINERTRANGNVGLSESQSGKGGRNA